MFFLRTSFDVFFDVLTVVDVYMTATTAVTISSEHMLSECLKIKMRLEIKMDYFINNICYIPPAWKRQPRW